MNNLKLNQSSYETNSLIESIEALGINGNIVPMSWCAHIQFENGKPDFLSMMLLAELVYWHRPEVVARDEKTGKILQWRKRFKGEKLHRSRSSLAKKFFVSERQITDALTRLEEDGFIEREICHQTNRLYLTPVVSKLSEITIRLERKYVNNGEVVHSSTSSKEEEEDSTNADASDSVETQDHEQSNERPRVMDYPPLYKNKEITEENTADRKASNTHAAVNRKEKIASSPWSETESFIGNSLTENQQDAVTRQLKRMNLPSETLQLLKQEVEAGLLDLTCFSKTGRAFHRKLNAISTSIQNGKWTRPLSLDQKKYETNLSQVKQKNTQTHDLFLSWNKLWNELGTMCQWIQASSTDELKQQHKQRHQACLLELTSTEEKLVALNASIDFKTIKQKNKERLHVQ